ncbi:MAG: DUF1295 domain-containing protein [Wenzhouxiangellaceae bacterium]
MPLDLNASLNALLWMLALGAGVWALSLPLRNASIVDSFWSLFFVVGTWAFASTIEAGGARAVLTGVLLGLWALRLSLYITWRNWGHGEDRRYRKIRERNEPGFWIKSLFYVFAFQAVLAWIVAMPVFAAMSSQRPPGWLDLLGVALWLTGFLFETLGDWQLARFKADPANAGRVMDRGLWRYTRHPNYFGEALIWWGFWLIAVSAGHAWTVFAPVVMTLMLLKVSGVALLEDDLKSRKPEYADYIRRTNAFIPGPRKEI